MTSYAWDPQEDYIFVPDLDGSVYLYEYENNWDELDTMGTETHGVTEPRRCNWSPNGDYLGISIRMPGKEPFSQSTAPPTRLL